MLRLITTLAWLHLKQLGRLFLDLGPIRMLVLAIILLFGIGAVCQMILQTNNPLWSGLILGVTILSFHLQRNDKHFLAQLHPQVWWWYAFSYTFLLTPFLICYGLTTHWWMIPVLLALLAITALLNTTLRFRINTIALPLPMLPPHLFEWKSGIRKMGLRMVLVYGLTVLFSGHIIAIPLGLLAMTLLIASCYLHAESLPMLQALEQKAGPFLRHKIANSMAYFWLLHSPLLLLFFVWHWPYWYIGLALVVITSLVLAFSIVLKYALYEPAASMQNNMILILLMVFSFLIPFLAPLPLIMLWRYYHKAIHNLKNYLYVTH